MDDLFSEFFNEYRVDVNMDELTLEQAIELFETQYMASRNLAARTRVEYKKDLLQLAEFVGPTTLVEKVGLRTLQAFLARLDDQGLSGVTRRRKVASIKTFFAFLSVSELISKNPALQLIPPEREYKEPRFLTNREYQALLRACAHHPRDAAIIELILQTGIRIPPKNLIYGKNWSGRCRHLLVEYQSRSVVRKGEAGWSGSW